MNLFSSSLRVQDLWMSKGVIPKSKHSSQCFFTDRYDFRSWQNESIISCIWQFDSHGILDEKISVKILIGSSCRRVKLAGLLYFELSSPRCCYCFNSNLRTSNKVGIIWRFLVTCPTPLNKRLLNMSKIQNTYWIQPKLGIRMEIHISQDIFQGSHKVLHGSSFFGGKLSSSHVIFLAWRPGSTWLFTPMKAKVSIDICTNTSRSLVWFSILSPHSVSSRFHCIRISIHIYNRNDVKGKQGSKFDGLWIFRQEEISNIYSSRGRNPFSCVNTYRCLINDEYNLLPPLKTMDWFPWPNRTPRIDLFS